MHDRTSDDALARLETELRQSRTQAWDVETFLAKRHQAKIEALTEDAPPRERLWTVAKGVAWEIMALFGFLMLHLIVGLWIIGGEFPLHVHPPEQVENIIPPPLPGK